jgi:hypothetical protein
MNKVTIGGSYRFGLLAGSTGFMLLSMFCTAYVLMSMAPGYLSIPHAGKFAFAAGVVSEIFKNIMIPISIIFIFRNRSFFVGGFALLVGCLLLVLSMWSTITFFQIGALDDKQEVVSSNERYQSLSNQIIVVDQGIESQKEYISGLSTVLSRKLDINYISSSDATTDAQKDAQKNLRNLIKERQKLTSEKSQVSLTSQSEAPDYSNFYLLFSIILDIAPIIGLIVLDHDRQNRSELKYFQKKEASVQSLLRRSESPFVSIKDETRKLSVKNPGEVPSPAPEKIDAFEGYYREILNLIERGSLTLSIKNIRNAVGCTEREARRINKSLKESGDLDDLVAQQA